MPDRPGFRVGNAIVVKQNVMCPDRLTLSLAGWQGRVKEIYAEEGTLEIAWDSVTLRSLPDDYIRECEIEGLGWASMILGFDEMEPASPRDTLKDVSQTYRAISKQHQWDHLADENPGIAEVLRDLNDPDMFECLEAWEAHLTQVLTFPFEARVEELMRGGPIRVGDLLQVLRIDDEDDKYGLLVDVRLGRQKYTFPLCDLEATDVNSSNYQPLRDYVVWFANR